jgi:3-oxoacyl-[acyl-carrier protein] reductase
MRLDGSVAIVTGANHGIGAATAERLAEAGTKVLLTYLRLPAPKDGADKRSRIARIRATASGEEVAAKIREAGGAAVAVEADLTQPSTVGSLFDRAESEFGPVNIVINNAAFAAHDTFGGDVSGGNVSAPLFSSDGFLAHARLNCGVPGEMLAELARRRSGSDTGPAAVVNVSTDGSPGFVGEVSYGASKFALESLSRAAAAELGPLGIRVNVVAPGPIQTGYITAEEEAKIAAATPLRRVGQPEDVADVICFLCSDEARWLTGQTLFVGGGWRVW